LDSGYYAACAGLRAQSQALELAAHNLANLNTTAYRAQQATFQSVLASKGAALLNPLNQAINNFGVLGGSRVDLSAGSLERTDNSLDLGIEGKGFFVVQTARGNLYTRNGNFTLSAKRQMITPEGDLVVGQNGPIVVSSGTLSVSADGTLSVNGAVAGKLRIVEFLPGAELSSAGSSYYSARDGATQPPANSYVRQGMLEGSNVNPMAAMVGLISIQRQAEMLQRTLSAFHTEFNHIAASELPQI